MALLESSGHFDQDAHVRMAMKYLEEKKVKTLLRDLTQSLLLAQPADPRSYILEELRSETSGPSGSSSSTNACAFLKSSRSSARDAVRELLRSAKDGLGVQAVSFFSAPKGRGRSVLGLGDAQQLSGDAFILVDSSDGRSPGEAGSSVVAECLGSALASESGAAADTCVAWPVRSAQGATHSTAAQHWLKPCGDFWLEPSFKSFRVYRSGIYKEAWIPHREYNAIVFVRCPAIIAKCSRLQHGQDPAIQAAENTPDVVPRDEHEHVTDYVTVLSGPLAGSSGSCRQKALLRATAEKRSKHDLQAEHCEIADTSCLQAMAIRFCGAAQLAVCISGSLPASASAQSTRFSVLPGIEARPSTAYTGLAAFPSKLAAWNGRARLRRSRIQRSQDTQNDRGLSPADGLETRTQVWRPLLKGGTVGSLAFLAGVVEAACVTRYRCYVNMMTGNTVMAGAALAFAQWGKLAFFSTLLLHYVSGVALFRFLDSRLGPRRVAATAPLILLIHCSFDALSCRYDSSWPLPLLALGCGVVNAFSSGSSGVVTNMLTGHWHILASSMADLMSGSTLDQSKRSVARRSLGVVCAFVLGVLSAQLLLRCGLPVRFWWLGVAYACLEDGEIARRTSTRNLSLRASSVRGISDLIAHCVDGCLSGEGLQMSLQRSEGGSPGLLTGVEGVLLAELNLPAEVSEKLSSLQLYALLLEERLNCIHWEAEARRSAAVVESLLQGVEVLAKPSEEWRESNIQSAAEVPKEVLRGGIELPVASVWEADDRLGSFVKVGGAEGRNSPSALTTEAFRLSSEDAARVICAEGSWDGSGSKPTSSREICIVLHGIGKPTVLDFSDDPSSKAVEPLRLDHFDIVAAESLCASSLRAALQAQSMISELTKRKHSAEQMQSLVSELSMTASTTDLVCSIEKAVQAVTQASKCMVFFIDDDEAWAPPTATVPEPARMVLDVGLPGRIAMLAKERSEPLGALIYNDPATCPYWDDVEFGVDQKASVMVAPIMSAGKDLKPLGLIVASAKMARSKEGDLLSKLWGPISVDFTQQDADFLEWLASAASSHLDRLSLDVMWTRALLEREGGEGAAQDESEDLLVSEYYTEEAMATRSRARTDGSTGRTGSKASGHGRSVGRVNTVHKFTGHVATALDFTSSKGMLALVQEVEKTCIRDLAAEPHVAVSQWEIDYWVLTSHEQFVLLVTAIRQLDIFDHLSIDDGVLMRFFQAVKNTYRSVPFHNFHHAMSTTHYASKMAKVADLSAYLTYPELFALVIGALCHDLDHRGYNNAFEIMTRSELALRYNDSSPLENHHCARAFETALNGVDCNIFEDLGPEVYNLVRKRMVA
ncbi:Pde9a, partial [Symbiodinium microadriaticum]